MGYDDFHPFRTQYEARDGRSILLRPVSVDDAAALHEAMSQPRATWGTLQMPMTLQAKRRRMLESNETSQDTWSIGAEMDGRIVGSCSLHLTSRPRIRHSAGIGMAVHDDFHGIGVGSALMAGLIELADEWLNLHRLELTVFTDNAPGIALYRKFGFELEGTHRDFAWRGGHYRDVHTMARIRANA